MSRILKISIIAAFIASPCVAHTNAGVPMLALAWPLQWLALIPIILLECEVARRSLHMPFKALIWPIGKAILISTLVGIPLAWFVMLIPLFVVGMSLGHISKSTEIPKYIEYALFPLTAAWVGDNVWQIYFAFIFLAVPFCIASIFIEERVLRRVLPDQNHSVIHTCTVRANVLSYVLLSALALIFPLTN